MKNELNPSIRTLVVAVLLLALPVSAAPLSIVGDTGDGMVRSDDTSTTDGILAYVTRPTTDEHSNAVFVFDLTGVDTITNAEFGAYLAGISGNLADTSLTASLQGVGYGETATDWTDSVAYHNSSTPDTGSVFIESPFVEANSPVSQYYTDNSQTLVDFLNDRTDNFVYLRINNNSDTTRNYASWRFNTAEASSNKPYLEVTVIPEPGTLALFGLAGVVAMALCRRKK